MKNGDMSNPTAEELTEFTSNRRVSLGKINRKRRYVGHIHQSRGMRRFSDKMRTQYQNADSGEWTDDEMTYGELVESVPDPLDIDDIIYDQRRNELVREAVDGLTERQAQIVKLRFWENKTLEEVAADLGGSRERVRQIERGAIRDLRHPFGIAESLHSFVGGKAIVVPQSTSDLVDESRDESEFSPAVNFREELVLDEIYFYEPSPIHKDESPAVDIQTLFRRVGKQLKIADMDELREILQGLQ